VYGGGWQVVCVLEGALPLGIEEAVLQRRQREVEHQSALLATEVTMAFNQVPSRGALSA
jgi:hypothetical protein